METQLSDEATSRTSSRPGNASASGEGEGAATPREDRGVGAEETKEQVEAPGTPETEQKGKEAGKESEARECRERDRRAWEKEKQKEKEKAQPERDGAQKARRERDRREEKRKERPLVDRESTSAVGPSSGPQRDEKQSGTDGTRVRQETVFYF